MDRLAAEPDFAGVERIETEQDAREFRAAGPHETEQAEHFAAVQGEVDVLDDAVRAEVAAWQAARPACGADVRAG